MQETQTVTQKIDEVLKANHTYHFMTDRVSFRSVETKTSKKHFVAGYISVPELDLQNDIITENAIKSMLEQIRRKTITFDYEHEAFTKDRTILPVGKIVDAKVDDRGLWVEAELNEASPKFKALWDSIKGGFVNAFSIAFKPLKTATKAVNNTIVRMIDDLVLLNVAMTGTPANEGAVMVDYGLKSVMLKAIQDMEKIEGEIPSDLVVVPRALMNELKSLEGKMAEPEKKAIEAPVPEVKSAESVVEVAEKKEEIAPVVEQKSAEDPILKSLNEQLKALKDRVEAQDKELADFKNNAVFKSIIPEQPVAAENKLPKSVLGMIR